MYPMYFCYLTGSTKQTSEVLVERTQLEKVMHVMNSFTTSEVSWG